jgi:hypothetical protein
MTNDTIASLKEKIRRLEIKRQDAANAVAVSYEDEKLLAPGDTIGLEKVTKDRTESRDVVTQLDSQLAEERGKLRTLEQKPPEPEPDPKPEPSPEPEPEINHAKGIAEKEAERLKRQESAAKKGPGLVKGPKF